MASIQEIRKILSDNQGEVLSFIWDYFQSEGEWIPIRALHKRFGGKSRSREILDGLGGNVVFLRDDAGLQRYELTLLGILLTHAGERYEILLSKYLLFVKEKCYEDPSRTHVSSDEVTKSLALESDEIRILGFLVRHERLSSGGSFGKAQWNAGIPSSIEDIPDDPIPYLCKTIGEKFDPTIPLDPYDRHSYLMAKSPGEPSSNFTFVKNSKLKDQLESDWQEANLVYETQAWKCCVVLCGGILEGMLIDALQNREQEASQAYKKPKKREGSRKINQWSLEDMVDVAKEIGILGKGTFHLSHAIRQYRNLIHPAKQVAEGNKITEDLATMAMSSIRTFIKELEN